MKKMQDKMNMKNAYNTFVESTSNDKVSKQAALKIELERMQATYQNYL